MMTPYYAKQNLEMNKEQMKFLKLHTEWILEFNDMRELGIAVKQKLMSKLVDLEEQNKQLENIINGSK
jgi:hypothetical protein